MLIMTLTVLAAMAIGSAAIGALLALSNRRPPVDDYTNLSDFI